MGGRKVPRGRVKRVNSRKRQGGRIKTREEREAQREESRGTEQVVASSGKGNGRNTNNNGFRDRQTQRRSVGARRRWGR